VACHEDAARLPFLLVTPVIPVAGVLKMPDLFGALGAWVHGSPRQEARVSLAPALRCVT
jgi:undecaprenyl-diphosphatase